MGYPVDLDEMDENKLRDELTRREHLRAKGLCDYCRRDPSTPSCKMGDRHTTGEPPTRLVLRLTLDEAQEIRQLLHVAQIQPEFRPTAQKLLRQLGA